jgi:MFS family permease
LQCSWGVAGVLGYSATGLLIDNGLSTEWRRPFFVFGGIMMAMLILLFLILPARPRYQSGRLISSAEPEVLTTTTTASSITSSNDNDDNDGRHAPAPMSQVFKVSTPVWYPFLPFVCVCMCNQASHVVV